MSTRPFCAEVSSAAAESLAATASRIDHWLLVEYSGMWPHDPLDAPGHADAVFLQRPARMFEGGATWRNSSGCCRGRGSCS